MLARLRAVSGIVLILLHPGLPLCKFVVYYRDHYIVFAVSIIPRPGVGYVSTADGEASFTCIISGNASVQWLLNGSLIHTLNSSHAETTVEMSGEFTAGTLRLSNLPLTYNNTRITCVTTLSATTPAQVLNATTSLLLQGRQQN